MPAPQRQQGVALAVALILLVLITLSGLGAIRSTTMQQSMTANLYDRGQAFQSTEAAIRTAASLIGTDSSLVARNCQSGGVVCPQNPFTDSTLNASDIHTVNTGTGSGQYTAQSNAAGQPQYVIENMGNWSDPNSHRRTANAHNVGSQGTTTTNVYYRITARSADPATTGGRAQVTLQAIFKQSD